MGINIGKEEIKYIFETLRNLRKRDWAGIIFILVVLAHIGITYKSDLKQIYRVVVYDRDDIKREILENKRKQDSLRVEQKRIQDSIFVAKRKLKLRKMTAQRQMKRIINHELTKICIRWNADYASVNLFSNGDSTFNGWHFEKMNRELEGRKKGKIALLQNVKSWSTDPFLEEMYFLDEKLILYYKDVNKEGSEYLQRALGYYGVKSVVYVAYKEYGYLSGFMTIEYPMVTNFNEAQKDAMMKELMNLSRLLDQYQKTKRDIKALEEFIYKHKGIEQVVNTK